MEILRFGPGFRRAAPAAGTRGLADQTIWSDPRARITELAMSRRALLPPQTSPDLGLLIVQNALTIPVKMVSVTAQMRAVSI